MLNFIISVLVIEWISLVFLSNTEEAIRIRVEERHREDIHESIIDMNRTLVKIIDEIAELRKKTEINNTSVAQESGNQFKEPVAKISQPTGGPQLIRLRRP